MFFRCILFFIIFYNCFANAQSKNNELVEFKDYQLSSEKYISGEGGKLYMKVNFWGASNNAGIYRVHEGIDFASLMSVVGGPSQFANLKKIRLYREKPDDNGQLVYFVDLTTFLKTGDRSNFPKIKPNDTIVINKTFTGILIQDIATFQTLLTLFTFFIQIGTIMN